MKLSVKGFALAAGILWGLAVFVMTWISYLQGGGNTLIALARMYIGYSVTPIGSFIGLIYGFFDGLIAGALFAWLYNLLAGKKGKPA